ncbi:MAG: hypothetical protein ACXVEF_10325 [Polyangiales bacterium]
MLLALVVFAATGYVACSGDDRVFGAGGDSSSSDDVISVDDTTSGSDTTDPGDTTDDTDDTNHDTKDDVPSTSD